MSLSLGLSEDQFVRQLRQYLPLLSNRIFYHTLDRNKRLKHANIKCPVDIRNLKYRGVIVIASHSLDGQMHVGMKSSSQSTISTASQSARYNTTSELQRSICEICSCTYRGSCLRCEQNNEYEESLRQDALANNTSANSTSGVVDSDFESGALTTEDLRAARVSFLCKNHVSQREEFGDDEVERFFDGNISENNEVDGVPAIVDDNSISEKELLRKAFDEYTLSDRARKTVIVQREQSKFWAVLFRQSLNLQVHAPNIRFAGEAGADAGGPLREFLTLVMKRIPSIPSMVFGNEKCICFTANPDSLIKQQYFLLGQISALSIIQNARGPECLHPALVRSFYDIIQPTGIEAVESHTIDLNLKSTMMFYLMWA